MNIVDMLDGARRVLEALRSKRTKEDIEQIFDISGEAEEKIGEMFEIGKDVAADYVKMTMIAYEALKQLQGGKDARTIVKPVSEMTTVQDIGAAVLAETSPDA